MLNSKYPYTLPPLAYPYDALEPYVDTETVHIHHDKHFQTYVDNLNKALTPYPSLQNRTLKQLATYQDTLPVDVARNAGGVYNHYLYFKNLAPQDERKPPSDQLLRKINSTFGSFDTFVKEFNNSAKSVFGSGWTTLARGQNGMLKIVSTKNQITPLLSGYTPIMLFDVWEHAYYLKYKNERIKYIENLWNVISFLED